jgi:restriction endonuclease S subunit
MTTEQKIQELEKQIEELKKESQKEGEMEQWFKSLLNGLEIEINDDYPNSVYYKKNGKVFFELHQNSEKTHFYCDYNLVWSVFNNKYNLNHIETQAFIKMMVEQHLKLGVVTPYGLIFSF